MARGVRASSSTAPAPLELPKVSFEKVEDSDLTSPTTGVDDKAARSYGYNDFSDFQRPEHYIRHIEPLEIDLARQVEYDMDEQDKEWLDNLNAERKKDQIDKVSYETFEIIMDRLEKEWFDLTKNIPKPDFAMPSEDSTCAICDDSEGENSNAIVFCDGCNLAVHQDCYGVPYIPEGQWLCRKCTVSPEVPVSCVLCPNEGGAFKQTTSGDWVHLLCAIWVPETRVANDVFMEPVTGIEKVSKQRWKLKCSICDIREGACIQCAKTSCFLAFHTTCARKEKLLLPMKSTQAESVTLTCYCDKHLPKEQAELREAALAAEEEQEDQEGTHLAKSSKSARAYAKTYKPGPPLVPAIIVDRITQYITKVRVRKQSDFLIMVCKYWSLKREARRGAPLLKRLHLEPWTAASSGKLQSEEERGMKLELLQILEKDLEQVRELSALAWKRESRKQQQVEILQQILTQSLFPHEARLRLAFERIVGYDKNEYFKNPVSKAEVPDYFDIILHPMCWSIIDTKLDRHEYWDIKEFRDDIELVLNNAIQYNKAGSPFHKAAQRIRNSAQPILQELERLSTKPITAAEDNPQPETMELEEEGEEVKTENPPSAVPPTSAVGNLEPPLELVGLLLSLDAIKDESDLVLNADPISSLLSYEFPVYKPPPPPPPPPSKPKKAPKSKSTRPERDRSGEYERYKAKKAEEKAARAEMEAAMLAAGVPDERLVIRTRRSAAAAAAATTSLEQSTSPFEDIMDTLELPAEPPLLPEPSSIAGPSRPRGPPEPLPSVPEVREDVDKQESFKYFNSGWILPSDQKRRTRAPPPPPPPPPPASDRSALPPPKKKMRMDRAASKLSVFSTAEEENETLQYNEPSGSGVSGMFDAGRASAPRSSRSDTSGLRALSQAAVAAAAAAAVDEKMDIDTPGPPITPKPSSSQTNPFLHTSPSDADANAMQMDVAPPSSRADNVPAPEPTYERSGLPRIGDAILTANGKVIIEELDSPLTRREKNLRRKAERERMKHTVSDPVVEDVGATVVAPGSGPTATADVAGSSAVPMCDDAGGNDPKITAVAEATNPSTASEPEPLAEPPADPIPALEPEPESIVDPIAESVPVPEPTKAKSKSIKGKQKAASDELSSLGEEGDEESHHAMGAPAAKAAPRTRQATAASTSAKASSSKQRTEITKLGEFTPGQDLEGGTLVWAKADTYPWWPGVIFETDDEQVPKQVRKLYDNMKKKNKNASLYFVRFFDKTQSWQCVGIEKLLALGENDELDADLVASQSRRQRWKNNNIRNECREAWRKAKQEIDTEAGDSDAED